MNEIEGPAAGEPQLELAVLGSGSAFSTVGHNAGYLVDGELLLDCGAPVTSLLGQMGRSTAELKFIAISHLHGDHLLHLPVLLAGRAESHPAAPPLRIVGPRDTAERLEQLGRLAFGDRFWEQVVDSQRPLVEEWSGGQSGQLGPFSLTAFQVEHASQLECLAFKVERRGVSLGYSGDTTLCPGIRELAGSVGHLLCECTSMSQPTPIHLWRAEVEELMRAAPHTRFILTHLSERAPVGGAILASDGLRLRLKRAPGG
jgi:ribonuclease BN (tRNA processing enzyme)